MHSSPFPYAAPLGRLLLCLIFIASAAGKLADWPGTLKYMEPKQLPNAEALLSVAVALEIVGGLLVLLGLYTRLGALALLVFIVPVTLIMHNFWTIDSVTEAAHRQDQMINFMKNISITGGILIVLALGPGPYSIDERRRAKPPAAP